MNKNFNIELINIKHMIIYIIKNLELNNTLFNKNYIKTKELFLSTSYNSDNKEEIYKTMNSLIIKKNNNLHCYNSKCYKQLNIKCDEIIYSNNDFYIKLYAHNNIVFIDNEFKTKYIRVSFTINNIMIKNNLIIIIGENNNILINNFTMYEFMDYEAVDLYNYILFYSIKNSILLNNNGQLINYKLNNINVKMIIDFIKRFGEMKKLIECYVNENYVNENELNENELNELNENELNENELNENELNENELNENT
jgi:hypothetical protein